MGPHQTQEQQQRPTMCHQGREEKSAESQFEQPQSRGGCPCTWSCAERHPPSSMQLGARSPAVCQQSRCIPETCTIQGPNVPARSPPQDRDHPEELSQRRGAEGTEDRIAQSGVSHRHSLSAVQTAQTAACLLPHPIPFCLEFTLLTFSSAK